MDRRSLQGIIFDMDGVLVESELILRRAAIEKFAEKGLTVKSEDFIDFIGTGEDRYLGGVAEKYGFDIDIEKFKPETYQLYYELLSGNLKTVPGVFEFIEKCRTQDIKLSVASSADFEKLAVNFSEAGLDFETFDAVITGDDVQRKKPAPDIFLLAAKKMGVAPQDCLVIEDALNGIEAAHAADCKCLAMATSFTPDKLQAADWIVKDFTEIDDSILNW